jgi:hypothetical protein
VSLGLSVLRRDGSGYGAAGDFGKRSPTIAIPEWILMSDYDRYGSKKCGNQSAYYMPRKVAPER